MNTIKLYHATNVPINLIGIEKETMYFTSSLDAATSWGDEHYDNYRIITIDINLSDVVEFVPILGREQFMINDFERLEIDYNVNFPIVSCKNCTDGFIVKNINNYTLKYN